MAASARWCRSRQCWKSVGRTAPENSLAAVWQPRPVDGPVTVVAWAPGRVNLIGDHTDYTGGLACPMALPVGTSVELRPGGHVLRLSSDVDPRPATVDLSHVRPGPGIELPRSWAGPGLAALEPPWSRLVAAVAVAVGATVGGAGSVRTELSVGAGLASSAAFEVALALALVRATGAPSNDRPEVLEGIELARACQRAEQWATGVPCGLLDQLTAVAAVEGHVLVIDCARGEVRPVALPDGAVVVVAGPAGRRSLAGSAYAERRRQCEAAESVIGPLRQASVDDLAALTGLAGPAAGQDEWATIGRRARHVITENERVARFAEALAAGDLVAAGRLMNESHASLRDDFEVSTPALDALVRELASTPGVYGARLTGAGFGGCAVALAAPGSPVRGRRYVPGGAATATVMPSP